MNMKMVKNIQKTTPESEEFWKNYTGFNQDDKLNPTFMVRK